MAKTQNSYNSASYINNNTKLNLCQVHNPEMIGYKLTSHEGMTYNNTQWGENVTHRARKGKMEFCFDTAIHFYSDPLLAVFCNPIYGAFENPILWEGKTKAKGETETDGLKSICKEFTTNQRIPLPEITLEQRVEVAIRCALKVYKAYGFKGWAEKWLSGEDRSASAAYRAAIATVATRGAATRAAYSAATAGAGTTDATRNSDATKAAVIAACAATYDGDNTTSIKFDLLSIIKEVVIL